MKRILTTTTFFVCCIFLLSSFSLMENPQDPPHSKKKTRHINLVRVDDDGNKTELDTIIEGDDVFVWNGDTIGNAKGFKWSSDGDFDFDSLAELPEFDFDFDIAGDGDEQVFVMKSRKDGKSNHDVMVWHDKDGKRVFAPGMVHPPLPPLPPNVPHAPGMIHIEKLNQGNVIDLSDPGIIEYKKKKISGGREKITIIRHEVDEDEMQQEEIIIGGHGMHPPFVVNEDENVKMIEKDGKQIKIKELKKNGRKDVEVETETKKGDAKTENN